jgi:site-specific recombinase XerD
VYGSMHLDAHPVVEQNASVIAQTNPGPACANDGITLLSKQEAVLNNIEGWEKAYQAPLFTPTPKAAQRVLEFFTAQINNDHTRRAYLNATRRFAAWCDHKNIYELARVQPFHVAAFIKDLQNDLSPPSVKQHLAALRMLFDWLVTGHVIDTNPAHSVRGPKYIVKKGKTPVLTADEARALLDSIPIVKPVEEGAATTQPDLLGLRDRALIGMMAYSFARVGTVTKMKVGDYFVQGRRRWVRLHEKGGKEHDVPCHHNLNHFLDEYIDAAGIADDVDGYLFRTAAGKTGLLSDKPLYQQDAYRMIQRRAKAAGIETRIGQSHFPRHGHHRLSKEQRQAGSGAAHRQP